MTLAEGVSRAVSAIGTTIASLRSEIADLRSRDSGWTTDPTGILNPEEGVSLISFSARKSHGVATMYAQVSYAFDGSNMQIATFADGPWVPAGRAVGIAAATSPSATPKAGRVLIAPSSTSPGGVMTLTWSGDSCELSVTYPVL